MFAYCNGNPIRFSDPTGHAIWGTNTVAICDGGCGLSTTEYQYAQELDKLSHGEINLETFGVSSDCSTRITKRTLTVDVNKPLLYLSGLGFDAAGSVVEGFAAQDITGLGEYGVAILKILIPSPADIAYNGMPKLPNGEYTVFEIDTTVSKTPYFCPVTCTNMFIESHIVTTFYSLNNPDYMIFGGVLATQEYYQIYR